MKNLTHFLLRNLADHPDRTGVQDSEQAGTVTLKLNVADEDKGKIIGKKGKVIKAIRALVAAVGAKTQQKSVVDID